MKTIVIIGQGQLGQALTCLHSSHQHRVITVSRNHNQSLSDYHTAIPADLDNLCNAIDLPQHIDCLYYLAPPSDTSLQDLRLKRFIELHRHLHIDHIIYISTSGVYGDSQGEWITELTPVNPGADRARRRLNAEQQLITYCMDTKTSLTILRCAAIYSPKTVNKERITANQKPVITSQQAPFTNRIHIKDLTQVCWQAMNMPAPEYEIYNVSDGHPSTTTAHAWLLSDLAGVPRNKEVDISEAEQFYSPAYMSYLNESKKLDISKLKLHLKPEFTFEDCHDGILDCLNHKKSE